MFIFLPVLVLFSTALALLILRFLRPNFKFSWILALGGAVLSFVGVLLWKVRFPDFAFLPAWQPWTVFTYTPTWVADGISWPYALALSALATAVILTAIIRTEKNPMPWAGTLLLTALGILAVSAGDPLTLILAWTAIDLVELIIMLGSVDGESQSQSVIVAFAIRVVGTGLVIWANAISSDPHIPLSFNNITGNAGIFLLFASGLRLGVLPLHLPYRKENFIRRGFGTSLRLISASASLLLLARIPASVLASPWIPYLMILTALAAVYAGWMWLRASDEILGRPFWVLGMAALAVASTLRANPNGSVSWGVVLVLSGGLVFLYSARHRTIVWLPLLGLWGLLTLPFSPSAGVWSSDKSPSWIFLLPFLLAQALLIAGYVRHTSHPGGTNFEALERWVGILYRFGLILLSGSLLLLGFWGWEGAQKFGIWWSTLSVLFLAAGIFVLSRKILPHPSRSIADWRDVIRLDPLNKVLLAILRSLETVTRLITSTLEGEGGILWSILLLVLILSLLTGGAG